MRNPVLKLTALVAFLALAPSSFAAGRACMGLLSSPKGFALEGRYYSGADSFYSLTAGADIYGMPTGRCLRPGWMVNFSGARLLRSLDGGDVRYDFFAGPGVGFGVVRDYEKYVHSDTRAFLRNNYGAVVAASLCAGVDLTFQSRISLSLSWRADLGIHLREEEDFDYTLNSFYTNGILRALIPQLSIFVDLR